MRGLTQTFHRSRLRLWHNALAVALVWTAIALFNAHPGEIPLVVTDVDMPRLGGGALASALLQFHPDLRIVAMSGLSRQESDGSNVPKIQKLAHAFLHKPFTQEDLLGAVHRLLHPPEKT